MGATSSGAIHGTPSGVFFSCACRAAASSLASSPVGVWPLAARAAA